MKIAMVLPKLMLFVIVLIQNVKAQKYVAIIGAMPEEISTYKRHIEDPGVVVFEGISFTVGTIKGRNVVVVGSGVGKVNAAMVSTLLIQRFKPSAVFFTGVGGGLGKNVDIGDIIISDSVVQYDFGTLNADNSVTYWGAKNPVNNKQNPIYFQSDTRLLSIAKSQIGKIQLTPVAVKNGSKMPAIRTGIVATGDLFISSPKKKHELNATLKADAVEMEGGAVAQVCYQQNVPFLIIRSISDLADTESGVNFDEFLTTASSNAAGLLEAVIASLPPDSTQTTVHYSKTELYFGLTYDKGRITSAQWQQFLDNYVTPVFRDGFTVVNAYGQWFNKRKKVIIKEPSNVVIIIHEDLPAVEAAIDKIREKYCKMYNQESVLRADAKLDSVSF